jgi:hypothetical protein
MDQGWTLIGVTLNNVGVVNSVIGIRIRTATAFDNMVFPQESGLVYENRNSEKYDTYIGSYCQSLTTAGHGMTANMGRLYIWKNFSNPSGDA